MRYPASVHVSGSAHQRDGLNLARREPRLRLLDELVQTARAIEQRILGVQVQMNEVRMRHALNFGRELFVVERRLLTVPSLASLLGGTGG